MSDLQGLISGVESRVNKDALEAAKLKMGSVQDEGAVILKELRSIADKLSRNNIKYQDTEIVINVDLLPDLLQACMHSSMRKPFELVDSGTHISRHWDPNATSITDSRGDWETTETPWKESRGTVLPITLSLVELRKSEYENGSVRLFKVNPDKSLKGDVFLVYNARNGSSDFGKSISGQYLLDILIGEPELVSYIDRTARGRTSSGW